jgi:antitoxin ParD1/3/4
MPQGTRVLAIGLQWEKDYITSMSISLTPEQERLIQTKLQSGKYRSSEEVLEMALRLLDEYDRVDAEWVEEVRAKIDAAIEASTHTPPIDGETFVNKILERFQQADKA